MAEAYNSTDRTSIDTNPKTPRLIFEDTVTASGFSSYDGGYLVEYAIDISNYNQIKAVWNEVGPSTLKVEVMHVLPGSEYSYFYAAPYYRRYTGASAVRTAWCNVRVMSQVVDISDVYNSSLFIEYFNSHSNVADLWSAYYTQQFKYKIWSTVF